MRRPIVSKSERSGTGVDMANLSKAVCHGESDKCRFGNPPQESNFQRLGIRVLSQAATSASTACPNSVLAPLRKTSVSGSENVPGWVSWKTLVWVTAYHSFGGEGEALNTPHDTPPYPFMPSPTFGLSSWKCCSNHSLNASNDRTVCPRLRFVVVDLRT